MREEAGSPSGPPVPFLTNLFGLGGEPPAIDKPEKKIIGCPHSNLSTGGPSQQNVRFRVNSRNSYFPTRVPSTMNMPQRKSMIHWTTTVAHQKPWFVVVSRNHFARKADLSYQASGEGGVLVRQVHYTSGACCQGMLGLELFSN